jgi:hypothetical protein
LVEGDDNDTDADDDAEDDDEADEAEPPGLADVVLAASVMTGSSYVMTGS